MRAAIFLAVMVAVAGPVLAQDGGAMQRCRALTDTGARLACYDAIPLGELAKPAVAGVATPVAAAAPPASWFGLERKSPNHETDLVESQIDGLFEGWEARTLIRLANGQVWQIADGSNGAYLLKSPKVKVRRGALGAFYMEFAGANKAPRVQRLQ